MSRWKPKAALACLLGISLAGLESLSAAPPLTTVQDILYRADGSRFSGTVMINWRSFDAEDTSNIATSNLQLRIVNGLLRVRLVPTTTGSSGAHYSVRYVYNGKVQFTESWAVPPSVSPVRVRDVRIAGAGSTIGQSTQIEISNVNGLQEELNLRPLVGLNFVPSRAAIINIDGALEGAVGDPGECVRVDGSAGPCGSGALGIAAATFVDGETPNGAVNGSNLSYTLANTPNPASSLLLYRNGMLQKLNLDYTMSGASINFVSAAVPQSGDVLLASYRTLGSGTTLPQVLCTNSGSATNQTSSTALGTCVIANNVLKPGDRVEISFDYSHEGTATGFQLTVLWGSTTLASRTAAANVAVATGRASLSVIPTGGIWSAQSWGNNLTLAQDANSTSEGGTAGITVSLNGNMSSSTSETVTLRNFTVTRFAAP
ncbi:MAG: hypothetical protein FJW20_17940 [Acidimicrobiia bacterium]|nr:hypothetical protein [Acidimicrobiia bacterium]